MAAYLPSLLQNHFIGELRGGTHDAVSFFKGSRKKQINSLTSAPGKPVETILNNVASQESCMAFVESIPVWQTTKSWSMLDKDWVWIWLGVVPLI